jgi:enoyl-CoA hydratase/carnithine racemase
LLQLSAPDLLTFARMTGDLVLAMRRCLQPIVAAVDGVCAGAGSKVAFLFNWVGLAGCDMRAR